MKLAIAMVAAIALLTACGEDAGPPRPQWRVTLATDARIPQFGDRLLVEVMFEDGTLACGGCRREFGATTHDALPMSFGLVPPESGRRLLLRARLHRVATTNSRGLPGGAAHIDALGWLPPLSDGITQVDLDLRMSCLGKPSTIEQGKAPMTCDPATGMMVEVPELGASDQPRPATGSWPTGQQIDCVGTPPTGAVCVPGGAFLLGSPISIPIPDEFAPSPERLVVVHRFALDRDEVTVGLTRQLLREGALSGQPRQGAGCTFLGVEDATNDGLPLNCLEQGLALDLCEARGMRLPTESEWEWAAGNLDREDPFPWGTDTDICEHAILGRAALLAEDGVLGDVGCRAASDGTFRPYGLQPGGHPDDVNVTGVRNLAGSLSEWVADDLAAYSAPCWDLPAPIEDPRCDLGVLAQQKAIRGSNWLLNRRVEVFYRDGAPANLLTENVGVRCAADMP